MRIITNLIGDNPQWQRLFRAFEASVRENCPDAELHVIRSERGPIRKNLPAHCSLNTQKLHVWRAAVHAYDGELVLIDADTIVLRDLTEAFERFRFDVAYTERPGAFRINAGVVFVQANRYSRRFFDRWVMINDALFDNQPECLAAITEHAGLNQAALIHLLDSPTICDTLELPCEVWNSTQETWHTVCDQTYVVHIKNKLRALALGKLEPSLVNMTPPTEALNAGVPETQSILPAFEAWMKYDKEEVLC